MTATPIPRTLAMTAYADLDISVIDELPPGRQPVVTVVVPDSRRDEVLQRVRQVCGKGQQSYWVCTLIEESESLQCQAAIDTADQLRRDFPELRIGLIHGRIKTQEKENIMTAFKGGELDMLVATTVVEVGVDVPGARLMIIENAERLGLAQLHQLRGRIGRGSDKSTCVLMYHPPLSDQGKARLATLRDTSDGFKVARKDMELRGPGEILGTRQTGMLQFRVADLLRDQDLIPRVSHTANLLLTKYPERAKLIVRRWLGDATHYGSV
jgi:ATP-dependent DNA helicase RecG